MMSRATMQTPFSAWSARLVACVDDDGEPVSAWLASKLLEMRCSLPREAEDIPPADLEDLTEALYWDFLGTCDLKHLAMLEEREEDAERRIHTLEARGRAAASEVDTHIANLRRSMRRGEITSENIKTTYYHIALVEQKLIAAESWLRNRIASIRAEVSDFQEDVFDSLQGYGEVEHLYSVHWTTNSIRRRAIASNRLELQTGGSEIAISRKRKLSDYLRDEEHTAPSNRAIPQAHIKEAIRIAVEREREEAELLKQRYAAKQTAEKAAKEIKSNEREVERKRKVTIEKRERQYLAQREKYLAKKAKKSSTAEEGTKALRQEMDRKRKAAVEKRQRKYLAERAKNGSGRRR
ncbi:MULTISPECIES: cell envelope integrity protein TolA [unclassified Mesorhizobium]|uniref:cell envelope integrity protein TolA n=1 Tax=unclassified Mesorhizobium TaxID=325217 RepID=UPI001CCC9EFB|nr:MULTISPECIES: cell envelope integrity protein TolA [unclassified Mesorhizobium]MBZ9916586.1 cell envelope integrity protein TolA [Mesorhizobium sp. BR1-1-7]MBZ9952877.1 cell envelope integrity protein TolA [Mesorhizobium sp. BR1-1-15]MBZ9972596.1 cell envelope integrity protein TolA [Mesorhizobium sp. BR1-1-12]